MHWLGKAWRRCNVGVLGQTAFCVLGYTRLTRWLSKPAGRWRLRAERRRTRQSSCSRLPLCACSWRTAALRPTASSSWKVEYSVRLSETEPWTSGIDVEYVRQLQVVWHVPGLQCPRRGHRGGGPCVPQPHHFFTDIAAGVKLSPCLRLCRAGRGGAGGASSKI